MGHDGVVSDGYLPPQWPDRVPGLDHPQFEARARGFLLDLCPPEYRGYPELGRHLLLLVRLTARQLAAQRVGTENAAAALRADLTDFVGVDVVEDGLRILRAEQYRLEHQMAQVSVLEQALRGGRFVRRL